MRLTVVVLWGMASVLAASSSNAQTAARGRLIEVRPRYQMLETPEQRAAREREELQRREQELAAREQALQEAATRRAQEEAAAQRTAEEQRLARVRQAQRAAQEREWLAAEAARADGLAYHDGDVRLPNDVATLRLGDDFRFVNAADAQMLRTRRGEGAATDLSGAILPAGVSPFSANGWAAYLRFEAVGNVAEPQPGSLIAGQLWPDLSEGALHDNARRRELGLAAMQPSAWAQEPLYDADAQRLRWAVEYQTATDARVVQYEARWLTRTGVLAMSATIAQTDWARVRPALDRLEQLIQVNDGFAHADYNAATDQRSELTPAALIIDVRPDEPSGIAWLWNLIVSFKAFILIALVAFAALAFIWRDERREARA